MVQLDDLDRAILKLLKQDARLTISELAERLNRPESTIHFRIKKLIEKGVIDRYTIILGEPLKPKSVVAVYIETEIPVIEDFLEKYINHITKTLSMLPNVLAVARSGRNGIIALIGGETEEQIEKFVDDTIRTLPSLRKVEVFPFTNIVKGEDVIGFLVDV
ncbi:predicted transcription regulator, Lrp/AsnC family [Thermococcus kodakarensis KOD1]|uniref:Predicted transcription regulator, Lrp/AsnC family n=1 Tax=Thermococcus kodakarensis (strain ATCC BAA-918 / JCM 12380 / KOD1) TaxID=69014 RepID=Q5JD90_THEKO|nr:Lrp/AsnC family transcriptional regulator [Thermococcus kodakarensis]WCN28564.1 Lrp/AsnC family transcriptional regulator [Thermococcus kodakarensis]WCN30861.1 Lrp/AsnC family transcriptional regulator [Thermococcus kodakarensis]BAD84697.1 predicted transcription regulator, Lrp/AsnC family [Thermococcus kodakarensis KOD1]